jgi:hypothetical protein
MNPTTTTEIRSTGQRQNETAYLVGPDGIVSEASIRGITAYEVTTEKTYVEVGRDEDGKPQFHENVSESHGEPFVPTWTVTGFPNPTVELTAALLGDSTLETAAKAGFVRVSEEDGIKAIEAQKAALAAKKADELKARNAESAKNAKAAAEAKATKDKEIAAWAKANKVPDAVLRKLLA